MYVMKHKDRYVIYDAKGRVIIISRNRSIAIKYSGVNR